jgi:hypothetical protein
LFRRLLVTSGIAYLPPKCVEQNGICFLTALHYLPSWKWAKESNRKPKYNNNKNNESALFFTTVAFRLHKSGSFVLVVFFCGLMLDSTRKDRACLSLCHINVLSGPVSHGRTDDFLSRLTFFFSRQCRHVGDNRKQVPKGRMNGKGEKNHTRLVVPHNLWLATAT